MHGWFEQREDDYDRNQRIWFATSVGICYDSPSAKLLIESPLPTLLHFSNPPLYQMVCEQLKPCIGGTCLFEGALGLILAMSDDLFLLVHDFIDLLPTKLFLLCPDPLSRSRINR